MLTLYPKGKKENLTDDEVAKLRKLAKKIAHG